MSNQASSYNPPYDGSRRLVRHFFYYAAAAAVVAVIGIWTAYSFETAIVVALALYPPVTTAWYYSTAEAVSAPGFSKMTRTAKINFVLRFSGLLMSAAWFLHKVSKLFT